MTFHILSIFPAIFDSYLKESLVARAVKKGLLRIRIYNLRDFVKGRRRETERSSFRQVDDRPFGGGPGMVLKVEPISRALASLPKAKGKRRVILFSTRGKKLDAKTARRLSRYHELVLISGRYEGVDERVAGHLADEEISIGDYVLSGGELPSLVLLEAVARFLPGFLGKRESLEEVKGSYPVYTRPEVFAPRKGKKWSVPKVLLSGDHKKIEQWRRRT